MTSRFLRTLAALFAATLLISCDEEEFASVPAPQELTREAIGHYCNMIVLDHKGPKGQILVEGSEEPIWFTSVRDTVAFTMLPDEPKKLSAIYVTDVGEANWDAPEPGTWIDARAAWYVVGSDRVGGMGAPEAVPFGDKAKAEHFAGEHGGTVVAFADIPESAILGHEGQSTADMDRDGHAGHEGHEGHDMKQEAMQPASHDSKSQDHSNHDHSGHEKTSQ